MNNIHIIIFAKTPLAGVAKTLLIPALGKLKSAELAEKMFAYTLQEALAANVGTVELCLSPSKHHPVWQKFTIPKNVVVSEQGEGDLGCRMARVSKVALHNNNSVLLMGTDCPGLNKEVIKKAAQSLQDNDACMVPVNDGGYALLGFNEFSERYFVDIPWSTDAVATITKGRFNTLHKKLIQLPSLYDIDEPHDLQWLPQQWLNELNVNSDTLFIN